MIRVKWFIVIAALLFLSNAVPAAASSSIGHFSFTLNGYTVTGDLDNGVVTHDGHVTMQMTVNQTNPISLGFVYITGSGVWSGTTNFATLQGSIRNVYGEIDVCVSGQCEEGNFTATGSWTGALSWSGVYGSLASGTFQGQLNLVNAPPAQAGPIVVTGDWSATFSI